MGIMISMRRCLALALGIACIILPGGKAAANAIPIPTGAQLKDFVEGRIKGFVVGKAVTVATKAVIGARTWTFAMGDDATDFDEDGGVFTVWAECDSSAPHAASSAYAAVGPGWPLWSDKVGGTISTGVCTHLKQRPVARGGATAGTRIWLDDSSKMMLAEDTMPYLTYELAMSGISLNSSPVPDDLVLTGSASSVHIRATAYVASKTIDSAFDPTTEALLGVLFEAEASWDWAGNFTATGDWSPSDFTVDSQGLTATLNTAVFQGHMLPAAYNTEYDVVLDADLQSAGVVVPEPGSMSLMALCGLAMLRRRR